MRSYIAAAFPFFLILVSARLVMTPLFLSFEYTRSGFPSDPYGFSMQDRLDYAPYALQYLLNDTDIDFLGNLRFTDGKEMYNVRELQHMRDVKEVTQFAFTFALIIGFMAIVSVLALRQLAPRLLWQALFSGSMLTLALIASVVLIAITSWDTFFTTFHGLFFAGGTWQFAYSDTLIRLFPEQFWFDAALTIGAFSVSTALIVLWVSVQRMNKKHSILTPLSTNDKLPQ
ncbi:MAG: TIGR01906 family membrane protein [Anaerolineae bacterium]